MEKKILFVLKELNLREQFLPNFLRECFYAISSKIRENANINSCKPFSLHGIQLCRHYSKDGGATLRLGGGGTISDSILGGAQDTFSY